MRLVYFASLRERIGKSEEELDLPDSLRTIGELIDWLAARDEFAQPPHDAFRELVARRVVQQVERGRIAVGQHAAQIGHNQRSAVRRHTRAIEHEEAESMVMGAMKMAEASTLYKGGMTVPRATARYAEKMHGALTKMMGDMIASKGVTVVDDGTLADRRGNECRWLHGRRRA